MSYTTEVKSGSLLFAPMEGITDGPYRKVIKRLFPEWNRHCCDFLRCPTEGTYNEKKIIEHFGMEEFENEDNRINTTYQILTSPRANTEDTVKKIAKLGFKHLDLNLGCPSKKVNSHQGGAYLLSDLTKLREVLSRIRDCYPYMFTVKIRIGYRNTDLFEESLKTIEECGAEAITIHGRTRDQLYKGTANWDYIAKAVEVCNVPVIGNGDVWTCEDIDAIQKHTNCHAVMVARGALKTPWLAKLYRLKQENHELDENQILRFRKGFIKSYYRLLEEEYRKMDWKIENLHKRFKGLTRYLFDDLENGDVTRSQLLRSKSLAEFNHILSKSL
jgi:tRNA-dihydrouridine synthase B